MDQFDCFRFTFYLKISTADSRASVLSTSQNYPYLAADHHRGTALVSYEKRRVIHNDREALFHSQVPPNFTMGKYVQVR